MTENIADLTELMKGIELLILDVDGVLTDGTLQYTETGEMVKNFNAKDGLGIRLAMEYGMEVAVITARQSPPLAKRMGDLKITRFYAGFDNKIEAFTKLLEDTGAAREKVAYVGDDILDLPVMREVGLPIAVGDAHSCAKDVARMVTEAVGGRGAVREVVDALVASRMDLAEAYDKFLAERMGKERMTKL